MSYFRCTIVLSAWAALLAGCGGGSPSPLESSANALLVPLKRSQTFGFTGAEQRFTVPSGVKRVTIAASGASGGFCGLNCKDYGHPGNGGWLKATILVTSGEMLYLFVGGDAGFNGGGTCSVVNTRCNSLLSGGGASDVRQGGNSLTKRVVVAGGGGGPGYIFYDDTYYPYTGNGGAGGGRSGTAGTSGSGHGVGGFGGGPGRQRAGGAGGAGGSGNSNGGCNGGYGGRGKLGIGGEGAVSCGGPGGGGGGGYYGGGGGGSGGHNDSVSGGGGGGGGGSSFAAKRAFDVTEKAGGGAHQGNGQIVISW